MTNLKQQEEFIAFRESCIWLQNCFNTFQHLYASGADTEAALRKTAPSFFGDLHSILQEYFFLQVRKITDASSLSNSKRKNLTINSVNESLDRSSLMSQEISELSDSILSYRKLTSNISNRVVAHTDKATVLSKRLVGEHSETELEAFMSNVRAYTDAVGNALGVGPLDYRTQAGPGDVLDLISVLKRA
jgi:hypothetical protein